MKKANSLSGHAGYSVIEMLIVLVILGIIVSFAVMALGNSNNIIERQTIAKEFKVALERARYDSVKRRPVTCEDMSRVVITSNASFKYTTDMNQDGKLDESTESRIVDFGSRSNVRIVDDPAPTFPIYIRFDHRGNTLSGACGSEVATDTPTTFCQLPCATPDYTNSTSVYVSPSGTVSLMVGNETVPSFTDPSVSGVPENDSINEYLAVWHGTPPTPTPIDSGTPSPGPSTTPSPDPSTTPSPGPSTTPSPDPSTTPTPAPSTTPTPTPTPTPVACATRAPWDVPGTPPTCQCNPPQFVQASSGKCK